MIDIIFDILSGTLPITISISPSVAPPIPVDIYNTYGFYDIPNEEYIITITDASGCISTSNITTSTTTTTHTTFPCTLEGTILCNTVFPPVVPTTTTTTTTQYYFPCSTIKSYTSPITEYSIQLEPLGNTLIFQFAPGAIGDKVELLHNSIKVATTGMTTLNAGPFDNIYGTSPDFVIPDFAAVNLIDQFIGTTKTGTIPTRLTDFIADTGIVDVTPTMDQLIWWTYSNADYATTPVAIVRVTSIDSGIWDLQRLCPDSITTSTSTTSSTSSTTTTTTTKKPLPCALTGKIDCNYTTTTTSTTIPPTTTSTTSSTSTSSTTTSTTTIPPTTSSTSTTTTTLCVRPAGLTELTLYYSVNGIISSGSLTDATDANCYVVSHPDFTIASYTGQNDSIGLPMYSGISTDCSVIEDGYYFTLLSSIGPIYHVVSGILTEVLSIICPTTTSTTSTSSSTTTSTTTLYPPTTTTTSTSFSTTTTTTTIPPYPGCYGLIYNWYAFNGPSSIAKANAHVPDNIEWNTLLTTVGGTSIAGISLKQTGTSHWNVDSGTTNASGFTAMGTGVRQSSGVYQFLSALSLIWSTDLYDPLNGSGVQISASSNFVTTGNGLGKTGGGAIRLIMNTFPDSIDIGGTTGQYIGNDGQSYNCVYIGTQWWMAENLRELKYQDGSYIPEVTDNATWAALTTGALCAYNNNWTSYNNCGITPPTTTTTSTSTSTTTTSTSSTTTTTTTAHIVYSCNSNIIYSDSGIHYPKEIVVYVGPSTGWIQIDYNAKWVPDKFEVWYDGEMKLDIGYVSTDFGDPTWGPYLDGNLNACLDLLGEPHSSVTGYGIGSAYFPKTTSSLYATIKVYSPCAYTYWEFKMSCVLGIEPTTSSTTTTTTTQCIPLPAYLSFSNSVVTLYNEQVNINVIVNLPVTGNKIFSVQTDYLGVLETLLITIPSGSSIGTITKNYARGAVDQTVYASFISTPSCYSPTNTANTIIPLTTGTTTSTTSTSTSSTTSTSTSSTTSTSSSTTTTTTTSCTRPATIPLNIYYNFINTVTFVVTPDFHTNCDNAICAYNLYYGTPGYALNQYYADAVVSFDVNQKVYTNYGGTNCTTEGDGCYLAVDAGIPYIVTISGGIITYKTQALNYSIDHPNACPPPLYTGCVNYGALYNFYVVSDSRYIANTGWHVPTETEVMTLFSYLGGNMATIGGLLKEPGITHWDSPNTGASNTTGYNGVGNGERLYTDGSFQNLNQRADCWTSTVIGTDNSQGWTMFNTSAEVWGWDIGWEIRNGIAIRLIKDSTILSNGQKDSYTGNDGTVYPTICIGTQEWLATNLIETQFRNGNSITKITDNATWVARRSEAMCAYDNDWNNTGCYTPPSAPCLNLVITPGTYNSITITDVRTGDVSNYPTPFSSCSPAITIPANSVYVGRLGAFTYTLNSSVPINDIVLIIVATGSNPNYGNENFIITTNNGIPTITSPQMCFTTITGNTILSGLGIPLVGGGGGGKFIIHTSSPYTSLTISGDGGSAGSLLGICADSINSPICSNLNLFIGKHYQGGVIAYIAKLGDYGYVSGECHGMIVAIENANIIPTAWNVGTNFNTATGNGTEWVYGKGLNNSNAIVILQGNITNYAAKAARDYRGGGYNDWFLPSLDELELVWNNIQSTLPTGRFYWTSNEWKDDQNQAWVKYWGTGGYRFKAPKIITTNASSYSPYSLIGITSENLYVRPCRYF